MGEAIQKTQVVTLRVPVELKSRLDQQAKTQGVSLNNLANYMLTTQLSELETLSKIEQRITSKSLVSLKANVSAILSKVPRKSELPEWDKL
jgi:hypothetical protein